MREPKSSPPRPVVNAPALREGAGKLPEGQDGARRLLNRSESVVRALFLSTTGLPANAFYADTGRWLIRNGPDGDEVVVRETP